MMRAILLLLVGAFWATAQQGAASLSGSVFDEIGGPVISAKLSLRGSDGRLYLGRTTEQGGFRLARLEAGTYMLTVDQQGYCKHETKGIALAAGEQKTLQRLTLTAPPAGQECPQ